MKTIKAEFKVKYTKKCEHFNKKVGSILCVGERKVNDKECIHCKGYTEKLHNCNITGQTFLVTDTVQCDFKKIEPITLF